MNQHKVQQLIETTLRETKRAGIENLIAFMHRYDFYTCCSYSHNNWPGGMAEHVWAVYCFARELRDTRISDPLSLAYASDDKLALVCLLHDMGDMHVPRKVYDGTGHGKKARALLQPFNICTPAELATIELHKHSDAKSKLEDPHAIREYEVLHNLICSADHRASGTAWHTERYKNGLSQHHGVKCDVNHLRRVALDRTYQMINYKGYLDEDGQYFDTKGYGRSNIQWNLRQDLVQQIKALHQNRIQFAEQEDLFTAAHLYAQQNNKRICFVISCESSIPHDQERNLRMNNKVEQSLFVCSNILMAFYRCTHHHDFKYTFSMDNEVKAHYRQLSTYDGGIFMPNVTIIRDGHTQGFRQVIPWQCDVLLVPNMEVPSFFMTVE